MRQFIRNKTCRVLVGRSVLICLMLSLAVISPMFAHTGEQGGSGNEAVDVKGGNDSVELILHISPGTTTSVTELTEISGEIKNAETGEPVKNAKVTINAWHIEDEKTMAEMELYVPDGTFAWSNRFFDGAEHKLTVSVTPAEGGQAAFAPFSTEVVIDVEGVGPPAPVVIKTLVYLLGIAAAGMVAGYQLLKYFYRRPRAANAHS